MRQSVCVLLGCLLAASCSKNDTSPSTTSSTVTVAPPSVTETWQNTLAVGGSRFYSFPVSLNGTVNVTLAKLTEGGQDSEAAVGLALGFPAGTGCTANTSVTATVGTDPQVTNTYAPGIYCVKISDAGNLSGPAEFRILVAHP